MSGRPLLIVTLPVLTVLAICLYLRRRGRSDSDPPEPPPPDQTTGEPTTQQTTDEPTQQREEPAAEAEPEPAPEQSAGRDLGQVTAWVRDNIETRPERELVVEEPAAVRAEEAATVSAAPPSDVRDDLESTQEKVPEQKAPEQEKAPETAGLGFSEDALRELGDAIRHLDAAITDTGLARPDVPAPGDAPDSEGQKAANAAEGAPAAVQDTENVSEKTEIAKETTVTNETAPVTSAEPPLSSKQAPTTSAEPPPADTVKPQTAEAAQEEVTTTEDPPSTPAPSSGAEAPQSTVNGAAEAGADTASENSSDSGKGGSSASLEQTSPSNSPESAPLQTAVYDFLIPQKLCGRLIGKNGTFVNMLKARTGAHVVIRLHPVKSSVKICSVDGTQSEIDACLKMIREKFPINKFPAMTLEQLNRPTEQSLAVPDSQQLHLPQGVTCDVLVSAVVSAGQLFLQQHTHPTFRGLERLTTLMAACYADGTSTPELPRPVMASSICAAPVAGGWYRAQVVAFYPDSDEVDVRFMDFGGYSRIPAAHARQIRTDFMSLPFQAEECYLANVMPVSEDGWSVESGAVFEGLITDRALEAMVVGYAEDGTPFVNLYSIQSTEYGNNAISLVNQQLVESGAARWVENQA